MKSQSGFTLIEMVAVIIILAIMAATALPKFVNLGVEARQSVVEGVAGSMRATAALARAKWLAAMSANLDTVTLNGQAVSVVATADYMSGTSGQNMGLPTPTYLGIVNALDITHTAFASVADANGWSIWPVGVATSATCAATYTSATAANTMGVTTVKTACM